MKFIDLSRTILSKNKSEKVFETKNKKSRIIEFVFLKGEGISPHTHPYGEDSAVILDGKLTYYISNKSTIEAVAGEIVLGWQNVIHGYLNANDAPVHLLIFATPQTTGLEYPEDDDPKVVTIEQEKRKLSSNHTFNATSDLSTFEFVTIEGKYLEPREEGKVKIFLDFEQKHVFIFDDEDVELLSENKSIYVKYVSNS